MRAGQAEAEHAMVMAALATPARNPFDPIPLHPERRHHDHKTPAKLVAISRRTEAYNELRAKGFLTAVEMAARADVTLRQLQWWDEHHVASPLMVGRARLYSPETVRKVRLTAELRRLGIHLQSIKRLLSKPDVINWLSYDEAPRYMLTNGRRMMLASALIDLADKMLAAQKLWTGRIVLVMRPSA